MCGTIGWDGSALCCKQVKASYCSCSVPRHQCVWDTLGGPITFLGQYEDEDSDESTDMSLGSLEDDDYYGNNRETPGKSELQNSLYLKMKSVFYAHYI